MVSYDESIISAELSDTALAAALAQAAGERLAALQVRQVQEAAQSRGAEGDAASQEFLMKELRRTRPRDAVLSEEAADDHARLTAQRVWIIDPLDGTREFAEGRRDWAVHVALWERGALVAGAVALPGMDALYTDAPAETGHRRPEPGSGPLRIAVSRSRPPVLATEVANVLDAELVPMGSAGVKVCAVVSGDVDMYIHDGGQYEWDSAAPVAVARGAGLHVSRLDGTEPVYNQDDPYLPDLLVCRADLRGRVQEAIRQSRPAFAGTRG